MDVQDGPKLLNAFDVVTMFGGTTLTKMLTEEEELKADAKAQRSPQFVSAASPLDIVTRIGRSLSAMDCEPKVDTTSFKVKASIRTGKGEISVVVNVYALSDVLNFVEIHRGKGDLLEYNRIFNILRSDVADIVHASGSAVTPLQAGKAPIAPGTEAATPRTAEARQVVGA